MEDVKVNGKWKRIPANWTELQQNKKLFLFVIGLFFQDLTKEQIQNYAGLKMLGKSDVFIQRVTNVLNNPVQNIESVEIAQSLFITSELAKFITDIPLEIKENYFPKLLKFRKIFSADSVYKYFTAWEYALCEKAFFDFIETDKEIHLDKLIAVIYRRKRWFNFIRKLSKKYSGDKRQEYSDNYMLKRLKKVSKLSFVEKWLIFRWFAYQRELIIKAHPFTFKGKKSEKKVSIGTVWLDTILAMSQVGDEDKTAKTKLSIILRRIENDNKAYEESQKNNKK